MKPFSLVVAVSAALIVSTETTQAADENQAPALAAEELQELFPGNYEAEVAGYDMLITGSSNGTLKGQAFSRKDDGRWWVTEDTLCVAWSNWTDGKPMCGVITRQGDWYHSQNEEGEGMRFRRIQELASSTFKVERGKSSEDTR